MSGVEKKDVFKGAEEISFEGAKAIKCLLDPQTFVPEQFSVNVNASMLAWKQQSIHYVLFIVPPPADSNSLKLYSHLLMEGFTYKFDDSQKQHIMHKRLELSPSGSHATVDNVEHQATEQSTSPERPENVRSDDSSSPGSTSATWGSNTITESGSIVDDDSRQSEISGISGLTEWSSVIIPLCPADFMGLFDSSAVDGSGDGDNIE